MKINEKIKVLVNCFCREDLLGIYLHDFYVEIRFIDKNGLFNVSHHVIFEVSAIK